MMKNKKDITIQSTDSAILPAKLSHIDGLDGLRGIAVIGVILYHLFPNNIKGGFLGVSLFFVLSGYVIAATSENYWKSGKFNVFAFYKRRLSRIYPSLIIVVFVTIGILKMLSPNNLNGIREEITSIFLGYNNLWQISLNASYFTKIANASPFTHLWSLSIELQFYFIWPFFYILYRILNRSKLKKYSAYLFLIPAVLSILSLQLMFQPGQDVSNVYYSTGTRIFSLFMGAFLAVRKQRRNRHKLPRIRIKKAVYYFVILIILLIMSYLLIDGQAAFTYRIGLLGTTVLFCEILKLAVNPKLPIGKWLDCKPLSWIGKKSYEIYLWQYPVIFIFQFLKLDYVRISPLIISIVILIFAAWLQETLCTILKKIKYGGIGMIHIKKTAFWILTAFFTFTFVLGGCSAATAQNTKKDSQKQLQKELEVNSDILNQQEIQKIQSSENNSFDSVTAIGDSVMLGAAPSIQEVLPDCVIDAKESRQVSQADDVIRSMIQQGNLGQTIIIALGTNGSFSLSSGQNIIDQLGSDRKIFWVTVYGEHLQWQNDSNEKIYQIAENNENVHIIDWAEAAQDHPEWFYDDGIHLNVTGQAAYANLILDSML